MNFGVVPLILASSGLAQIALVDCTRQRRPDYKNTGPVSDTSTCGNILVTIWANIPVF
jgi:hypothetical protein